MFNSLCLIVENFRICNLRANKICGLADLWICNLRISEKKFADSHISEICGFAIAN
jgi:hypothetical protein